MQNARNYFKFFLIISTMLLSSCLSHHDNHGFMFDGVEKEVVKRGFADKRMVLSELGSPTLVLRVGYQENWLYISEKVRNLLFLKPKTTKRDVFIVNFDNKGVVSSVSEVDIGSQREYSFDSHRTEYESAKPGFFDSVFGNIGQVTPQ